MTTFNEWRAELEADWQSEYIDLYQAALEVFIKRARQGLCAALLSRQEGLMYQEHLQSMVVLALASLRRKEVTPKGVLAYFQRVRKDLEASVDTYVGADGAWGSLPGQMSARARCRAAARLKTLIDKELPFLEAFVQEEAN